MLREATALLVYLAASAASAAPQGIWPEEARDLPMSRPGWVLVVPAVRGGDGCIQLWDRFSPWSREWVVPRATPAGVRTVSISGDAEDQKLIRPEQLDNMSSETLRLLAGKYGAEAVAVAVEDGEGQVAVAVWKRGGHATWDVAPADAQPRKAALSAIDGLFSGVESRPEPAADVEGAAAILAQRITEEGLPEYRLQVDARAAGLAAASASLRVEARDGGTMDVVVLDGRDVEDVLRDAGIEVRPR